MFFSFSYSHHKSKLLGAAPERGDVRTVLFLLRFIIFLITLLFGLVVCMAVLLNL